MGIPKFKDVISVFRNNSSLLAPIVIGLVGVLLFIPTQLISGKLRKQIADESITRRGSQIKSLSDNPFSGKQWVEEQKFQKNYERDANEIALLGKQSTQRELLRYEIFPEPKDMSQFIFEEFGQKFRTGTDGLIADVNARDCPTDSELEKGLESSSGRYRSGRRRPRSEPSRMPVDRMLRGSYGRLAERDAAIEDFLCTARAKSASVYCNAFDLGGYEFWKEYEYTGQKKAVEDCWYHQLAYWIIEDVIDTIDTMNSESKNVFTSPVKRLMGISFTIGDRRAGRYGRYRGYGRRRTSRAKPEDAKPSYVVSYYDGLTEPCTGRLCNDDIDVVHFGVVVAVSTKEIFPFMQQLCSAKEHKFRGVFGEGQEQTFKHNQITILESKIEAIDRESIIHKLYRYGEDAVVELNLVCEYIFNKKGYEEIKPESVKESLKKEKEESQKPRRPVRPVRQPRISENQTLGIEQ